MLNENINATSIIVQSIEDDSGVIRENPNLNTDDVRE
jgi:hypothetical protein